MLEPMSLVDKAASPHDGGGLHRPDFKNDIVDLN
jgi:hypothetical protein